MTTNCGHLRELSREYYQGELGFEAYRAARVRLLDGLYGDGAAPSVDADSTQPHPRSAAVPPQQGETGKSGRSTLLWIGLLLVAAALIAAFLYRPGIEPGPADGGADPAAGIQPDATDPVQVLFEGFLSTNRWGVGEVADLTYQWDSLSAPQREAARSTPWFGAFSDAVREQIREQQALAEIDGDNGAADQLYLLESLARHMQLPTGGSAQMTE